MMLRDFNSAWIVSAVLFWQIISHATSKDLEDPSEIFGKYHTGVVTVIAGKNRGTGFSIDPNHTETVTGKKVRLVITAFHVVRGAQSVSLLIYQNEKNSEGEWKHNVCRASTYGFDITTDVAVLAISCNTCPCTRLGALPMRISTVSPGESVIIIGDSARRLPHSFSDGKLSATNITFYPMFPIYKNIDPEKFKATRAHGLTGSFGRGDSGSAVMDAAGKVIGMISGSKDDFHFCVTMHEILKEKEQILSTWSRPRFVGCTAHESALLGREYWGERSGKSIMEMNALASAMNAQYFAVAHDGAEAHAFTFHVLWWEIFLGNDYMVEDSPQCLCEANSFIDSNVVEHTKKGEVMCGCAENSCRSKQFYHRRTGEDNDRRWAIYETTNRKTGNSGFVPRKESLAMMENIAGEIDYWKKKARILEEETERFQSKHHFYYRVGIAVILCIGTSVVIWLYNRWRSTVRMLEKANTECEELKDQLRSTQQVASGDEEANLDTPEEPTS